MENLESEKRLEQVFSKLNMSHRIKNAIIHHTYPNFRALAEVYHSNARKLEALMLSMQSSLARDRADPAHPLPVPFSRLEALPVEEKSAAHQP